MEIPFVDLKAQYDTLKPELDRAFSEIFNHSAFIGGKAVESFEQNFSRFCGVNYCVGVGNGTDALFLALRALGIGRGDEVILPVNTFIATAEAVCMAQATVKFVDVCEDSYTIDCAQIEKAITAHTKAIIPVHLYGQAADMDKISAIAQRHNLKVIEDACQAHGAMYFSGQGKTKRRVGGFGDCGCFSFYPGKNLGAYGDGGAITTNNKDIAFYVRRFANHGRRENYLHSVPGINSRLDGLQAAVLNIKLRYLEEWTKLRRKNAHFYTDFFQHTDILPPREMAYGEHVYHLYVIRARQRERLTSFLKEHGIAAGLHYPVPLHLQEAFISLGYRRGDFPIAERCAQEILSLPLYPELSDAQISYVIGIVKKYNEHS